MTIAHAFLVACSIFAFEFWADPPALFNVTYAGVASHD